MYAPASRWRVAGCSGHAHRPGRGQQLRPRAADAVAAAAARVVALEAERGKCNLPAVADGAEPVGVRDPHVVEEHLVERRTAAHLLDWPDGDPGQVHRDDEGREPAMLDDIRIGAGDQLAPLRELGPAAPHLLAVDDPLVAVALGPAGQAGQVGAGAGFGEQLAAQLAGGQEPGHQRLALLVRAVHPHRRGDEAGRHAVGLVAGRRQVATLEVGELPGVGAGQPEPTLFRHRGDGVVAVLGLGLRPRLGTGQQVPLVLEGQGVEHGDVEVTLAPLEVAAVVTLRPALGVIVEPRLGRGGELLERRRLHDLRP